MSRHNKVNKNNYDQGGRLTPDEMGRERKRQGEVAGRAPNRERGRAKGASVGGRAAPAPSRTRNAREE